MKEMKAMMARRGDKGFTLMEMLIVVAIIAILVAIAIPIFNTQLDNARKGVDQANARSAESMAVAQAETTSNYTEKTFMFAKDANNTLSISDTAPTAGYNQSKTGALPDGTAAGLSGANTGYITVKVTESFVPTVAWVAA